MNTKTDTQRVKIGERQQSPIMLGDHYVWAERAKIVG